MIRTASDLVLLILIVFAVLLLVSVAVVEIGCAIRDHRRCQRLERLYALPPYEKESTWK